MKRNSEAETVRRYFSEPNRGHKKDDPMSHINPNIIPNPGSPVRVRTIGGEVMEGVVKAVCPDFDEVDRLLLIEGAGWWDIPLEDINEIGPTFRFADRRARLLTERRDKVERAA